METLGTTPEFTEVDIDKLLAVTSLIDKTVGRRALMEARGKAIMSDTHEVIEFGGLLLGGKYTFRWEMNGDEYNR